MPAHPILCPLCANVALVPRAAARFECVDMHGFFTLVIRSEGVPRVTEPLLKHGTTGLEFTLGRFTPAEWKLFTRDAGLEAG